MSAGPIRWETSDRNGIAGFESTDGWWFMTEYPVGTWNLFRNIDVPRDFGKFASSDDAKAHAQAVVDAERIRYNDESWMS